MMKTFNITFIDHYQTSFDYNSINSNELNVMTYEWIVLHMAVMWILLFPCCERILLLQCYI